MCNPVAYAALTVASAVQSYRTDKARAQNVNQQTQERGEDLRDEAIYKDNSLIRQRETKEDQLIEKKVKLQEDSLKKKGEVRLALFEKGISGNVFDSLIGDVERQEGKASNIIDENFDNYMLGMSQDRLAWNRRFTNQTNNLPRAYKPSFTSYAIEGATNISTLYMNNAAPKTPSASASSSNSINFNPDGST